MQQLFQSQNFYLISETASLHWNSELSGIENRQGQCFYIVEMFQVLTHQLLSMKDRSSQEQALGLVC